MSRLLQPFVLVVTALLVGAFLYVAARLAPGPAGAAALTLPFVLVWIVPVIYWSRPRERDETWFDEMLHLASYLSMAWVSFVVAFTLARDVVLLVTVTLRLDAAHGTAASWGTPAVLGASVIAMALGALTALRGPRVARVSVRVPGLHPDLVGVRIAQVSDLHDRLATDVEPLAALATDRAAFFVLGNHDCYSGAHAWIAHFRRLGVRVLLNEHDLWRKGGATLLIGGVVDPAYHGARPHIALDTAPPADFRLLLAHNPKLAPLGARAGFDLQLSGHTHAGQFFPWTLAVRLVHAPHVAGLSREGRMWVYVSAGTGTWGPPIRFGTRPEITLITLIRA